LAAAVSACRPWPPADPPLSQDAPVNDPDCLTSAADPAPQPARSLRGAQRYRFLLAPLSFAAGLASFLLIERQEWLAKWLSLQLLLVWLLTIAEPSLRPWLQQRRWLQHSPMVLRLGAQATHQEAFFFTLPFFLHSTDWGTGQAVFTGLVILAATVSMLDPLYFGAVLGRRWLYLLFDALAVFVVALTVGPILLQLTTAETVMLAAAAIALLSLPNLLQAMPAPRRYRWLLLPCLGALLGGVAWLARPWVPPATLWLGERAITQQVTVQERRPGAGLTVLSPQQLQAGGLYAFTAIRAPRGLQERVAHRWLQNGREVDRIPIEIVGGRSEGYRVWSHKTGFPADPRGAWAVQVVTEGGQLIGQLRFEVRGDPPAAPPS
jgi:hypothetical protein